MSYFQRNKIYYYTLFPYSNILLLIEIVIGLNRLSFGTVGDA